MANKPVPIIDRQLVMQRIAEGQSTRQAIVGTSIASNQTAARIKKCESHTITQLRQAYVEQINHYSREGQVDRAAMLADMVWADKVVRVGSVRPTGAYTAPLRADDCYITVPDWETRLKAIKYIDQLAGYTPCSGTQINVVQQMHA